MPSPVRPYFTRPGVSEYFAWRAGGEKHYGFDSYAPSGTPIYAIGTGVVVAKGYAALGFGHWVDVWYPTLGIREREAHMLKASPLAVGTPVTDQTQLGQIGNTGNARFIFWWHNGRKLSHVHSQAWRGNTTNGDRLVDPTKYWGGSASTNPEEYKHMKIIRDGSVADDDKSRALVGEITFQRLTRRAADEEAKLWGGSIGVTRSEWERFEARVEERRAELGLPPAGQVVDGDPALIAAAVDASLASRFDALPAVTAERITSAYQPARFENPR